MNKKGIAASRGYAIGKVFLKENEEIIITDSTVEDVESEKKLLEDSLAASKSQLEKVKEKAMKEMGQEKAAVFENQCAGG